MKHLIIIAILVSSMVALADGPGCLKKVYGDKAKFAKDLARHKLSTSQYVHALSWEVRILESYKKARGVHHRCKPQEYDAAILSLNQEINAVKGK